METTDTTPRAWSVTSAAGRFDERVVLAERDSEATYRALLDIIARTPRTHRIPALADARPRRAPEFDGLAADGLLSDGECLTGAEAEARLSRCIAHA